MYQAGRQHGQDLEASGPRPATAPIVMSWRDAWREQVHATQCMVRLATDSLTALGKRDREAASEVASHRSPGKHLWLRLVQDTSGSEAVVLKLGKLLGPSWLRSRGRSKQDGAEQLRGWIGEASVAARATAVQHLPWPHRLLSRAL